MVINYTLDEGAYAPLHGHEADAGFDLRIPDTYKPFIIAPGETATIDTGVHFAIPEGYVGFLKSKSGLNVKQGIQSEGVIDAGYTGSVVVKLYHHKESDWWDNCVLFNPGDKISQIVFLPIPSVELVQAESLEATERGDNGFGSTGR